MLNNVKALLVRVVGNFPIWVLNKRVFQTKTIQGVHSLY